MLHIIYIILICIAAYLVGSINFATVIAKLRKKDITKLGSGNPGTMNVMRSVGKWWGVLTFILDAFKGIGFTLIGLFLVDGAWNYPFGILFGFFVIIGHMFPVFNKFKGGKGVACTIGVYIALNHVAGLITLIVLILLLFVIKYGFIGSFLAVTAFSIHAIILCKDTPWAIAIIVVLWALVIFAHRSNIMRMIKGQENKLNMVGENEVKVLDKDAENKKEINDADTKDINVDKNIEDKKEDKE